MARGQFDLLASSFSFWCYTVGSCYFGSTAQLFETHSVHVAEELQFVLFDGCQLFHSLRSTKLADILEWLVSGEHPAIEMDLSSS